MAPSHLWMPTDTRSWCHLTPLLATPLPSISAFAFWIPCRYCQQVLICVTPLLPSPEPIPLPRMLSYPVPIPNLINPFFFNIQFRVIPWIEYWRIPWSPRKRKPQPTHVSMPTLLVLSYMWASGGCGLRLTHPASPTSDQDLAHGAHPATSPK